MIEDLKMEDQKKIIDDEDSDKISLERLEEQKLMSKFPGVKKAPVGSQFLQKRLQQRKFFDSGDYNMAKAKGLKLPVNSNVGGVQQPTDKPQQPPIAVSPGADNFPTELPMPVTETIRHCSLSVSIGDRRDLGSSGSPTGMEIPTPETVPLRKTSIVTTSGSKLSPQPLLHHSPTGANLLPGSLD